MAHIQVSEAQARFGRELAAVCEMAREGRLKQAWVHLCGLDKSIHRLLDRATPTTRIGAARAYQLYARTRDALRLQGAHRPQAKLYIVERP